MTIRLLALAALALASVGGTLPTTTGPAGGATSYFETRLRRFSC